jgi:hypothetical protein
VYTDNDQTDLGTEGQLDPVEEGQDEVLRWLLDMDLAEPEETLFGLSEEEYQDQGLTDYEAEVAARPLVRGNASSDDLDSYVAEEIVISSDSSDRSDIYAAQEAPAQAEEADEQAPAETMAIDYSRRAQPEQVNEVPEADGGAAGTGERGPGGRRLGFPRADRQRRHGREIPDHQAGQATDCRGGCGPADGE